MCTDELEIAACKLKVLDSPACGKPLVSAKPRKDVNTFFNNQLKFVSNTAASPRDIKCNQLKENNTGLPANLALSFGQVKAVVTL